MRIARLLILLMLISLGALAQQGSVRPGFFRISGISGELKFDGLYREQSLRRGPLQDTLYSSFFRGGILMNMHSFFWHPNFLQVDVGVEYSPEKSRDNYMIIPDQGETRTLQKLDIRTVLFQKKMISLSTFATIANTYSVRDSLTNIRTDSKNYGGLFFFRNKFLPVSVSYQQGELKQEELESGRLYSYNNSSLQGRVNKSFGHNDRHELLYTHTTFDRTEREMATVTNDYQDILLTNELYMDHRQRYRFNSIIDGSDQQGYDDMQRLQAFETMTFKLPAKFELMGNYTYYNIVRPNQEITQNTSRGVLRHKLFESLQSSVFYEYSDSKQTEFSETDTRTGVDLLYEKKIPTGQISLAYSYLLQQQDKKGESNNIQIMHEPYVLIDGIIVLLKRPFVDNTTVVVRDATGTTIYQPNLDYLLISHGNYVEIQRVPGGLIPSKGTVYLDYTATMPGDYTYDMKNEYYSAGISLFRQFLNLYYRHTKQDYANLKQTDFLTLNYYTQEIYGCRLEYKALSAGVEQDNNTSTIMPYELTRYFMSVQGHLGKRTLLSVNGNISRYHLVNDDLNQEYRDLSAQLAYNLTAKSKLNFEAATRTQKGQGINLDLKTARIEYTTMLKQMFLTLGVQSYQRDYMHETDDFKGVFFRFSRRF